MISIHDFGIDVKVYFLLGVKNRFPSLPCAKCNRYDKIKKNGFFWRYVVGPDTDGKSLWIPIRVFYCKRCHKVTSILPSFCIPYKIHTVLAFESFFFYLFFSNLSLDKIVKRSRKLSGYYQLAQAWIKSFKSNVVNLTAEVRSLWPRNYPRRSKAELPFRHQDIFPVWWSLQRLVRHPLFQSSPIYLPLEKAQYLLWEKRKLGLFAYLA